MADKQKQDVGDNSLAVQAQRDVTIINGIPFTEIEHIFTVLFENNFPKLQAIAALEAQKNVSNFVDGLKVAFVANHDRIDITKISDPDVQYMFNDIIKTSARRGIKVDAGILSELIVERLSKDSSDMLGLICTEAAEVIPRLSNEQIAFITLCHFMTNVTYSGINHIIRFEPYGQIAFPIITPCQNISEISKEFLAYTGVLTISTILGNGLYTGITEYYTFLNGRSEEDVRQQFEAYAPSYYAIMKLYEDCKAYQIHLTAVGKIIALANLKRVLPDLDYKVWIH